MGHLFNTATWAFIWIQCIYVFNAQYVPVQIGSFHVQNPGFVSIYSKANYSHRTEKYDLLICTFNANPLTHLDSAQIVRGIGKYVGSFSTVRPEVLTTDVKWPNEPSGVPEYIFGRQMVAVPYGFLVPLKTDGAIKLVDISGNKIGRPIQVTAGDSTGSWFYHRVIWHDMDKDGDMDIVTCRAREPIIPIGFGRKDQELLWLENPSNNISSPWKQHILAHGPDVYFQYTTLRTKAGPKDCIVVSQFFTKNLTIFWTTDPNENWSDASKVMSRAIDSTIGAAFEVVVQDLNNDGRLDLLVVSNGNNGSVVAYEIPDDFRSGTFVKHVLATGFTPRHPGTGKGSPGSAFTLHPQTNNTSTKPIIVVPGDDDGAAYYLTPRSQSTTDWSYLRTKFYDEGDGIVGAIAHADVNGDGFEELFVPAYTKNMVLVYTFSP
ncbi:hypothetical protein ACJMK2_020767 [Sinanodonta woodiana]|uniref:Uncharacterized protein n=1 Tax=Sinanodonta woodiana TaxID=1069815 RepID=A0ABD3U071_SINWO